MAGTEVWVLKEGIDPEQANVALAAGVDWEELAEPVAIEEVETGDYALSRPDDDPDGELGFHAVTRLYRNTTAELVEITVYDVEDGFAETITTTPGHPFWVKGGPGRRSLGDASDEASAKSGGGWTFAAEIAPGDTLTDADGGTLTVSAATHQARHAATYNFCVEGSHTYFVGCTSTWVHNDSSGQRLYIVYQAIDAESGLTYTGRASGVDMTPEQILRKRLSGHHRNLRPGTEEIKVVTESYGVARGGEDALHHRKRRKNRATKQINPVSRKRDSKARQKRAGYRAEFRKHQLENAASPEC